MAKVAAILAVAGGVFLFGNGAGMLQPARAAPASRAAARRLRHRDVRGAVGLQRLAVPADGGREVQEPQRNLPRAIIGGSLLVLAIYLAINAAYLYALPFWQVASANSTAYPEAPSVAARAVQTFLGARAAPVAALIFLISAAGSLEWHHPDARPGRLRLGARRPVLRPVRQA